MARPNSKRVTVMLKSPESGYYKVTTVKKGVKLENVKFYDPVVRHHVSAVQKKMPKHS